MPKIPKDIDLSQMSEERLQAKLESGYDDYKIGKAKDAKKSLFNLRAKLKVDYKENDVNTIIKNYRKKKRIKSTIF